MAKYTKYDLGQAILDVRNGQSLRKAALLWGVPLTTLHSRLHGQESRNEAAIPKQRLSTAQEKSLTTWILMQNDLGLPPTHAQIRQFTTRILAVKGDHQPLGKRWMQAFLRRNPSLRTQKAHSRESARINGATTEVIRPWFNRDTPKGRRGGHGSCHVYIITSHLEGACRGASPPPQSGLARNEGLPHSLAGPRPEGPLR